MHWYANARELGCGERTVVLSHGFGANQAFWDNLLPFLSQKNKVLLFDWDFTGAPETTEEESQRYTFDKFADDLIALMDERKVSGAVLVGHSMSAMIGCIASVKRPDLFAHIVLLCASPRYINSEEEGYVGGFDKASIDNMLAAMSSDFHAWVKAFVPNAAGNPTAAELVERSFLAMSPTVAHALAKIIFLGDQREVLDGVATPCKIVQVRDDLAASPSVGKYMQRRIKCGAALEVIDSVGHFPMLVAPKQLLDTLNSVLCGDDDDDDEKERKEARATDVEVNGDISISLPRV